MAKICICSIDIDQCDEQATCTTALYKALNDLLYSIYRAEIHKSDNYKNVEEWG